METASYITWGLVGFFTVQLLAYIGFTYSAVAGGAWLLLLLIFVIVTILCLYNYVQHILNNGGWMEDKLSPLVPLIAGYALMAMAILFGAQSANTFNETKTEVQRQWKQQTKMINSSLKK